MVLEESGGFRGKVTSRQGQDKGRPVSRETKNKEEKGAATTGKDRRTMWNFESPGHSLLILINKVQTLLI